MATLTLLAFAAFAALSVLGMANQLITKGMSHKQFRTNGNGPTIHSNKNTDFSFIATDLSPEPP